MAVAAFEKLRVVVIDDNDHMRTLLHAMLGGFGIRSVYGEANGRNGLATVQSVKPDFVVTDFAMQPVDGVQFVKMVRSFHTPLAWLPIIMLTGHNERRYVERARDAGISELLCKPVTPRDLYVRIVEIIERPRQFVKAPSFIGPDRRRKRVPAPAANDLKRRRTDYDFELEVQ